MLAKALTCAVVGLEGAIVEVEVDIAHGLPAFTIVGLPDAAVQEAKERVRAAIKNSGASSRSSASPSTWPPPTCARKGPAYDLPIAVGILLASEQIAPMTATGQSRRSSALFLGELSLDGTLRHTARHPADGRAGPEHGVRDGLRPRRRTPPRRRWSRAWTSSRSTSLAELVAHLRGDERIAPCAPQRCRRWPLRTARPTPPTSPTCRAGARQAGAGGGGGRRAQRADGRAARRGQDAAGARAALDPAAADASTRRWR